MRWRILLVVCILALVLLGCRGGPVSNRAGIGGAVNYTVEIWASKSCVRYFEIVTLRATVRNDGSRTQIVELEDRPVFDIFVGHPEQVRWSDGKPLTPDLTRLELKPGQSKSIEMQWEATGTTAAIVRFIHTPRYPDNPVEAGLSLYVGNCPGWGLRWP